MLMGIGRFLSGMPSGIEAHVYDKHIRAQGCNSSGSFTQDELHVVCQGYWQIHPMQRKILSRAGIAVSALIVLLGAGVYNRVAYHSVEMPIPTVQFEQEYDAEVIKHAQLLGEYNPRIPDN